MMDIANIVQYMTVAAIPLLLGITIHEAAHGYVARYFGDMTAAAQGRITLNPFAHIDLLGTIVVPFVMLVLSSGTIAFGFAKPVPVNFANLRHPKRDMIWVALAGPVSNFLQAIVWQMMLLFWVYLQVDFPYFLLMAQTGVLVNLVLCIVNLFPVPPLDGGRILVGVLPYKFAKAIAQIERYGFLIVMMLIVFGVFSTYWLKPLLYVGNQMIAWIMHPLKIILFNL